MRTESSCAAILRRPRHVREPWRDATLAAKSHETLCHNCVGWLLQPRSNIAICGIFGCTSLLRKPLIAPFVCTITSRRPLSVLTGAGCSRERRRAAVAVRPACEFVDCRRARELPWLVRGSEGAPVQDGELRRRRHFARKAATERVCATSARRRSSMASH